MDSENKDSVYFSDLDVQNIEYVNDIGTDKKYGISVSGILRRDDSENEKFIGSVVLDENTGEPIITEGTSFYTYPDGLINDGKKLLEGKAAVNVMGMLVSPDSGSFRKRKDVEINPDAQ